MLKRTFTAIVGITAAFFLIRSGGLIFASTVLVLALIGWYEFRVMMLSKGYKVYYLTSGTAVALLNILPAFGYKDTLVPILTAAIISIMLEGLYYHKRGNWAPEVALSSFSVLYIGLLFSHFIMLREVSSSMVKVIGMGSMSLGEVFLWLVLFGTWASDTFAYIFGCAFGKRPLCQAVSPKKSIEGAIAGFLGCVLVVMYLGTSILAFDILKTLILSILIAIFAPLGDLVESLLKRSFGVKDSGNVFPGHGGVLDRFDSVLFAIPITYYFIFYVFL
ncbi:MAG: CDP-archaeol synthase [Acholeplasmataceae bacterium]|jgi:phosphatidate cytidylyltransferase|nr:CDP-archaeol synthase [Acholeplasmataceae bacterium]